MGTDTFAVCLVATKLPSPRTSKVGLGKKGKYRRTWKSQKQYEFRVHLLQHRAGICLVKRRSSKTALAQNDWSQTTMMFILACTAK